jgi:phosphoheptose isomerase
MRTGTGPYFVEYGEDFYRAWRSIDLMAVRSAADVLINAYRTGARVFSCGNGGSASIANHFQCDHVKGIRAGSRLQPKVTSLSNSIELLTAIANDISYFDVFAYQLQSLASPGDVLVAISSSGSSGNIISAIRWANENAMRTIVLTGFDGGAARKLAQVSVHVNCDNYGIAEDVHQGIMHFLAQFISQAEAES